MVLPGLGENRGAIPAPDSMATTPKRSSNRLHNFTLPSLKWGSQRYLRCTKSSATSSAAADVSGSGDRRSPASRSDDSTSNWRTEFKPERNKAASARSSRKRKPRIDGVSGGGENDDGIDAVRKKLVLDLKNEADKMKDVILRSNEEEEEGKEEQTARAAAAEGVRPWNLRTRREEFKAPVGGGGSGKRLKIEEKKTNCSSPARTNGNGAVRLPNLRSNSEKTQQRAKFSLQLSKKEIEDDFLAMTGKRPPRRPIKRPKDVQRQIDTVFPGMWLTEVTADWYKVPEAPANNGKARKGKGLMYLSESDEES